MKQFLLPLNTKARVRFVDMVPLQPSRHHFIKTNSDHRQWQVEDCLEDCWYCYGGEKSFKRWPITLVVDDIEVATWSMPTAVAEKVATWQRDLGLDLFLAVDFAVERRGRGLDTLYSVIPSWTLQNA